jgi:predicted amidophosphoribosyltransferase
MGLLQLFVDAQCAVCHEVGTPLCRVCERAIRRRYLGVPADQRMASQNLQRLRDQLSDRSREQPPRNAGVELGLPVYAAAKYEAEIQQLVLATKRSGHPRLVSLLAALATDVVASAAQTLALRGLLILVPLHSGRATRTATGSDLVLVLARQTARALRRRGQRAVVADLLQTRPSRQTQKGLGRGERERNASHKYRVARNRCRQGALILFDDVMTTGASMRAADRAMTSAERTPVAAAVVAHRLSPIERTGALTLTLAALEAARGPRP